PPLPVVVVPLVMVPVDVVEVVPVPPPAPLLVVESSPVVVREVPALSLHALPKLSDAKKRQAKIERKEVAMVQAYAARFGFLQEFCSVAARAGKLQPRARPAARLRCVTRRGLRPACGSTRPVDAVARHVE